MDLKRAAPHIAHDALRLRQALEVYSHRGDVFAWTSWYVFARNLAQFFEPKGRRSDYILARQFFDVDEEWWAVVREQKGKYGPFMGHASVLANHLSEGRVKLEDEPGDTYAPSEDVTAALEALYVAFLARLPGGRREWFRWEPR